MTILNRKFQHNFPVKMPWKISCVKIFAFSKQNASFIFIQNKARWSKRVKVHVNCSIQEKKQNICFIYFGKHCIFKLYLTCYSQSGHFCCQIYILSYINFLCIFWYLISSTPVDTLYIYSTPVDTLYIYSTNITQSSTNIP